MRVVKTSLPLSANGKRIKFKILSGEIVYDSIGTLEIYESEGGGYIVNIHHQTGLAPGINGTLTHTTIPLNQQNVDLIKKSDEALPYEYEVADHSEFR